MKYLLLILFPILFGCNFFKRLDKHTPVSTQDSLHLLKKCNAVFPYDTSGTTKLVFINKRDSIDFYQKLADSLAAIKQKVKDSIALRYKDTCTSIVDRYNEGVELGVKIGRYQGQVLTEQKYKAIINFNDSIYRSQTDVLKHGFSGQIKQSNLERDTERIAKEKQQKSKDKWRLIALWAIIIGLCSVVGNILQFKSKK